MTLAWWYYVVSFVLAVLFAWLCAWIAGRKGYSPIVFGILGFFFFLITLIVLLVLPDKSRAPREYHGA